MLIVQILYRHVLVMFRVSGDINQHVSSLIHVC